MSVQPSLWDTPRDTISPVEGSGAPLSALPDGRMIDRSRLEASHASLSPRQAKERGLLTNGIYSRLSHGTSSSAHLARCLASRLAQMTASLGSTLYRLEWKTRDTPLGRTIFALRGSARPTSGNGFTGWPTPTSRDWKDGSENSNVPANCLLGREVWLAGWNTPRATDGSNGGPNQAGGALSADAALAGWNTPMAGTPAQKGYNAAGNTDYSRSVVALAGWATPAAQEPGGTPEMHLARKRKFIAQGVQMGAAITTLTHQAMLVGPARRTVFGEIVTGSSAVQNRGIPTDGGGQLNPEHSLWLMGIPAAFLSSALRGMLSASRKPRPSSKQESKRSKRLEAGK